MSARDELIDFLINYGGRCRDCADEDGFCPQTGIGCGQRRKAVEFILGAIDYGAKHGFAAGYRLIGPGELDQETIERCDAIVSNEANYAIGEPGTAYTRLLTVRNRVRALQSQEAGNEG